MGKLQGLSLGLLFGAGVAAAFNPCGAVMLPGYLAFLLGSGGGALRRAGPGVGLAAGLAMTGGFLTVFAAAGLGGAALGGILGHWLRWLAVGVGGLLVAAGLWQGLGHPLPGLPAAERLAGLLEPEARRRRGLLAVYLYGIAYAIASLGCTLPLFLALVAGAAGSGSLPVAILAFLAYAAGMGAVATALSVLTLGSRQLITARLARALPAVQRGGAVVMAAVGFYLLYYWLLGPGALPPV